MALYSALQKYQNYLDGGQPRQGSTAGYTEQQAPAEQPLGSDPSRQPQEPAAPAGAPSVPTSTNAEQTDFRSYDQDPAMTAIGAEGVDGQDPWTDLEAAYSEPQESGYDEMRIDEDRGAPPEQSEQSIEDLNEQAIRDLYEGVRDTSAEEEAIRARTQREMEQGTIDNRARMGALGFDRSGASVAMDADIRGDASSRATDEVMGLEADARDDWLRRVSTGIGADQSERELASRDAAREDYAGLLDEMLGNGGDGGFDALDEGQEFEDAIETGAMKPTGNTYPVGEDGWAFVEYEDENGNIQQRREQV